MNIAVATNKGAGFKLVDGPGLVGKSSTSLSHQQRSGRNIPRFHTRSSSVFPVGIEATTGDPGEIEGSGSHPAGPLRARHHLLDHLEIGSSMGLAVVWKSSADQRIVESGRIGNVNRRAVERCAFSFDGHIFVISGHINNDTDKRSTVIPEGHRHRHLGDPMHVVDGAVEGVNDPDSTLIPAISATLFAKNPVFWEVRSDHGPDGVLRIAVHLGYRVDGTLEFGIQRLKEPRLNDVGAGPGGTNSNPDISFPHVGDSTSRSRAVPIPTLQIVKAVLLAAAGAVVSVLAFPPYGPGWLVLLGVTLFLVALRLVDTPKRGLIVGAVYGLIFFGWLLAWLAQLELIALILVPVQAAFLAAYGWWLTKYNDRSPGAWLVLAVGGWAFMEMIRYYFPVGGLEWGATGYALSDGHWTRMPAAVVGVSGLTLLVVLAAAMLAQLITRRSGKATLVGFGVFVLVGGGSIGWLQIQTTSDGANPVTIVQGSTPCPFEHCPPDERLQTYEQHLALTETIASDLGGLVVWSEGSTGSFNADPVLNPEIGAAIGSQARRIDAWFVVGSDRPLDKTHWVNANIYFDREGQIVAEYRKQHPVPFGEYIPLRPLFEWIPALDRVPRDMIPGDGPVVVEGLGSVISFEGGFSRYALETRRAGADVIVVATNEASYGPDAATSDQFIGMTRMRAVELGVPVIHGAVTGKSTVVDIDGSIGVLSSLGTQEIIDDVYSTHTLDTPYTAIGDSVLYLTAVLGVLMWWRTTALVSSDDQILEEE